MGVPIMSEAIMAFRHVAASPELQQAERMRSKARHDEAQALRYAKREEKFEISKNALGLNLSIDDIIKLTGLAREEIEGLKITS